MSQPLMKSEEWDFLKSYLQSDQIMIEYGSGSSTKHLAKYVKTLYSIEHNAQWHSKVLKEIKEFNNVEYYLVPPEKSAPKSERSLRPAKYEYFTSYINWTKTREETFDVALIDGRARQWVAESLLNNINSDSLVFIHDWNPKLKPDYRVRYNRILDFYDIVKSVNMMTLLRKK
jgi:hypothetical protein